jgi:hypothetical protein
MEIIVFQYDFESCQFVAFRSDIIQDATLKIAQAKSKEFWNELESGQPKQIFIRNTTGKTIYYVDNFIHFVCRPKESN